MGTLADLPNINDREQDVFRDTVFGKLAKAVTSDPTNPLWTQLRDPQTMGMSAVSPSGATETAELIRLVGSNFETGPLPDISWDVVETNGGTAAGVTGQMVLATNTTADGEVTVQTTNRSEFVTATFNKAHLAVQNPSPLNPDVIREWGVYDPSTPIYSGDGVFLRNNSGNFELVRVKAGVEIEVVDESEFNGVDQTGIPTNILTKDGNVHIYEFIMNAGVILVRQDLKTIHIMRSLDAVLYETVHLPIGARCANINGNTTANELRSRGFANSRIGSLSGEPDSVTIDPASPASRTLKNSPGQVLLVMVTNPGTAGANLTLYDSATPTGPTFANVPLTTNLVSLPYDGRLNFGLSYSVTGNGFEVRLNWR